MNTREVTWGGLHTRLIEPDDPSGVKLNVFLNHGFGAPGEDLIPLAPAILKFERTLAETVRFVFPEAPLDLADWGMPGGRAWWQIDMWKLQQAVMTGAYRDLTKEIPAGLATAREQFLRLLQDCERDTRLPITQTVLGGFSQGAMLSTEIMLQLPVSPAGLIILSGTIINQDDWLARLRRHTGMDIFQSHGTYDSVLPCDIAAQLRDVLQSAGNRVEYVEFPGGHEIPFETIKAASAYLVNRMPA